jgi:hypothetical protein
MKTLETLEKGGKNPGKFRYGYVVWAKLLGRPSMGWLGAINILLKANQPKQILFPSNLEAEPRMLFAEWYTAKAHFVWQYLKGWAKNAVCMFCDKVLCGLSSFRAAAHLLASPVMGQVKAGILPS